MQKVVFYWIVLGSILFTISHVKAQSFKVQQFRHYPMTFLPLLTLSTTLTMKLVHY